MKNNAVVTDTGVEIYTSNILAYADEYIEHELDEERRKEIYTNNSIFTAMLLYISDRIPKPDNNDIQLLDNIFNIYIRLCTKYDKLPSLEKFSVLININPGTLSDWSSGVCRNNIYYDSNGKYIKDFPAWQLNHKGEQYRVEPSTAHAEAVKKWKNICKNFLVDSLQNSPGRDINKIFIAKAAYGMVETAPVPVINHEQHRTAEQIAADYGQQATLPGDVVPDF
ncbi:MAG: hypothetical protein IJ833_09485 [Lachnospiraceae bacterium]|nr:hypothetical protein [Lachnospiraceae bacterium]